MLIGDSRRYIAFKPVLTRVFDIAGFGDIGEIDSVSRPCAGLENLGLLYPNSDSRT